MSINRLISIKNPIIDALDMVGGDRSVDMPIFTNWAVQAEKEIASRFAMVVKKKVLTIKGCSAELPCCVVILQRAIMGDHGCDCESLFNTCFQNSGNYFINNTNQYSSGFLIVDYDPNSINYFSGFVDYQVQNNHIIKYDPYYLGANYNHILYVLLFPKVQHIETSDYLFYQDDQGN